MTFVVFASDRTACLSVVKKVIRIAISRYVLSYCSVRKEEADIQSREMTF